MGSTTGLDIAVSHCLVQLAQTHHHVEVARLTGSLNSIFVAYFVLFPRDTGSSHGIRSTFLLHPVIKYNNSLTTSGREFALVKSSLFLCICLTWRLNQECCHKINEQQVPASYRAFQRKPCKLKKMPSNHLTAERLRGF